MLAVTVQRSRNGELTWFNIEVQGKTMRVSAKRDGNKVILLVDADKKDVIVKREIKNIVQLLSSIRED